MNKTLSLLKKIKKNPDVFYKGKLNYQCYIDLSLLPKYNFPLKFYKSSILKSLEVSRPTSLIKRGFDFKCNDLLLELTDTQGILISNIHFYFLKELMYKQKKKTHYRKNGINIYEIISKPIMNVCEQLIQGKKIEELVIKECIIEKIELFKKEIIK